jgi:hypothetical protein
MQTNGSKKRASNVPLVMATRPTSWRKLRRRAMRGHVFDPVPAPDLRDQVQQQKASTPVTIDLTSDDSDDECY